MIETQDFLGNEIEVGDDVVFVQLGYRNLLIGTITSISPKTLIVQHARTNTGQVSTKQFHAQVIKVATIGKQRVAIR